VKQPPWPRLGQRNESLPAASGWEDHGGRALRMDLAQGEAAFIDEAALAAGVARERAERTALLGGENLGDGDGRRAWPQRPSCVMASASGSAKHEQDHESSDHSHDLPYAPPRRTPSRPPQPKELCGRQGQVLQATSY